MNSLYKRIVTIGMICLTAVLAWIYCVLEYRDEPVYIIGLSLILIVSLYALLNAYIGLRMEKENKMRNYIDSVVATTAAKLEQNHDNTDLERLSKAIYVQLRKSNTILTQMMNTDSKQAAQSMEHYSHLNEEMNRLIADSINKAVKIIVKYNQNNHDGMVSALSALSAELEHIGQELNRSMLTQTHNRAAESVTKPIELTTEPTIEPTDGTEIASYADMPAETPDLSSFFSEFEETDNIQGSGNTEEQAVSGESGLYPEAMDQDIIDAMLAESADIIPFPAKETEAEEETATDRVAPENDNPNRKLTPEEIAALFASASDEPEITVQTDEAVDVNTADDTTSMAEKPDTPLEAEPDDIQASPVNDNPNRQLTPEEIAALFASVH